MILILLGCLKKLYKKQCLVIIGMLSLFGPFLFILRSTNTGYYMVTRDEVRHNITIASRIESKIIATEKSETRNTTIPTILDNSAAKYSLTELLNLLGGTWHTAFIRKRIASNWEEWLSANRQIQEEKLLPQNRTRKKVVVYPGLILKTHFAKSAFNGAPLGELVQWSDLICGLYLLGHTILFEWDPQRVDNLLMSRLKVNTSNSTSAKPGCLESDIDLVYTDLIGHAGLTENTKKAFKYHFRILDCFGTEQAFNNPKYAQMKGLLHQSKGFGLRDLNLKQFYTIIGHTRDNSFLGFVVKDPARVNDNIIEKRNISLLYGKDQRFDSRQEVDLVTPILQKYTEVHTTMPQIQSHHKKWNFINHGILKYQDYQKLARSAKLVVGIGEPLEGPGILEAIANGCIFINPKIEMKFNNKPTNRTVTSQNVYCEKTIGPPHVYTVDYNNRALLEQTVRKALATPVKPYIPHEMTPAGFLLRLTLFVETQNFCDDVRPKWPPVSDMQIYIGSQSYSCDEVCDMKGLQCENSFFKHTNTVTVLKKKGLNCKNVDYIDEIFAPAYIPSESRCLLQKDSHLYSCASYLGPTPSVHRICPCRKYTTFGKYTCKWC